MTARLIIAAILGLVLLLVLIIRFRLPAMIAILVGAVLIGLGAGMSFEQIVDSVNDGVGNTLKGIALLVGLGSMFGAVLEISGGAQSLAVTMVRKFGDRKAAWALAVTGLVIAMPVFFDAGLIILIPLAFPWPGRPAVLPYIMPSRCWPVLLSDMLSFRRHPVPSWSLRCWAWTSDGSSASAWSAVSPP